MTKILLVEDDKGLQEIYGVRLKAEGYETAFANNGEEAISTVMKEKPDLILSDVMMPKISGFDMLDILKSNGSLENTKIVVMTALSSDDQRARGESLGVDKYLIKSQVGIEDVINSINEVINNKEQISTEITQSENEKTLAQEQDLIPIIDNNLNSKNNLINQKPQPIENKDTVVNSDRVEKNTIEKDKTGNQTIKSTLSREDVSPSKTNENIPQTTYLDRIPKHKERNLRDLIPPRR